ncbi:hypothetical protein [Cupriavidus pampae]|uniref:hypothetical protein n=1 Tax=Cupriavidus pampae TaxID=659251 RepID=UPI001CC7F79F|nr:hypothetical protein [Cupriavidus pampae]
MTVDGEETTVNVAKTGKTTWRAWGVFRGKSIEETGGTESGALSGWKRMADYLTND